MMNKKWIKFSSVALLTLYLAACDTPDEEAVEEESAEIVEEEEMSETADQSEEESGETDEEIDSDSDIEDDEEADSQAEQDEPAADLMETVQIEGMGEYYHTGDLVELTAVLSEDSDYDDWHWYLRTDDDSEWEMISGQNTNEFIGEAPEHTVEMRAVLYDDDHQAYAESEVIELEVDNH